jgi:hypothetical protein
MHQGLCEQLHTQIWAFILDKPPTAVVYARARSILYKLRTPFFADYCGLGYRVWQPPAQ